MPRKFLIISAGESNSAGRALNSSATVEERQPQPRLQYLNNSTLVFEPLLIGTNNIIDHEGATSGNGVVENPSWFSSRHGWCVPLSTAIRREELGQRPVFMVHTGQGGSQAAQWESLSFAPRMAKLISRVNAAKAAIGNDYDVIIWMTIGINDSINNGLGYRETFNSKMGIYISNIRAQFPGRRCPVLLTGLTTGHPEYTTEVQRVAANNSDCHFIPSTGASQSNLDGGDGNHWGYAGVQTIGKRLIQKTKEIYLPPAF